MTFSMRFFVSASPLGVDVSHVAKASLGPCYKKSCGQCNDILQGTDHVLVYSVVTYNFC
jgi:hypothetical protein